MSAQATLAGRALHADIFVHALDVAHCGGDAGGDCVDLHLYRFQAPIQGREALPCPVLVVSNEDKSERLHFDVLHLQYKDCKTKY